MENLLFLIIICILIRLKANNINNDSILINENPNNNSFLKTIFQLIIIHQLRKKFDTWSNKVLFLGNNLSIFCIFPKSRF